MRCCNGTAEAVLFPFVSRVRAHGLKAGFVKHPLDGAVEENGMVEVGDFWAEPKRDAGDGGPFEVAEFLANGSAFWGVRKNAVEAIEGQCEDEIVKLFRLTLFSILSLFPHAYLHLRRIGGEGFEPTAEV